LIGLNRDQPALFKEEAILKIATISEANKPCHNFPKSTGHNIKYYVPPQLVNIVGLKGYRFDPENIK